MFTAACGATVLYPSGPRDDLTRRHLFVLLTDPFGPAKQVLMVPVCSAASQCDNTCLISVGDHPFVRHESYVDYARCRLESANDLAKFVDSGYLVEKEPADGALVDRMGAGFSRSRFTKPFALEFYQNFVRYMSEHDHNN